MCGRFSNRYTWEELVRLYRLTDPKVAPNAYKPTWNAAPTQELAVIRPVEGGGRKASLLRWWLIPYFSPEPKTKYTTINARAETIRTSGTYKQSFERRRCIVPASGWYEWQKLDPTNPKAKQAIFLKPAGEKFAIAGVWDRWQKGDAPAIESFALVTVDASDSIGMYHNRMPLALDEAEFDRWMLGTPDEAASLLRPYPGTMEAWRVSSKVNAVKNDGPELAEPQF